MEEKECKDPRKLCLGEEIGNAITHGLGAVFGIFALVLLLIKSDTGKGIGISIVYGLSIFLLYLNSCLYHAFRYGGTTKRVFRRFDHLSIYVLIVGSYTPVLLGVDVKGGIYIYIVQWIIAIIGITFKAISPSKYEKIHLVNYLALGWIGIFIGTQIISYSSPLFLFIVLGGVVYSFGVIFYTREFRYAHFIWHFFVLGGTVLQFIGYYIYIFVNI